MYFCKAVFRRQNERFGQIIARNHQTFLFGVIQKCHGVFGIGGVIQIKNADHRRIPHRHIIADG